MDWYECLLANSLCVKAKNPLQSNGILSNIVDSFIYISGIPGSSWVSRCMYIWNQNPCNILRFSIIIPLVVVIKTSIIHALAQKQGTL